MGNVELAAANPLNHIAGAIALAASGPGSFIHFSSDSNITIDSVAASGPFGGVAGIHTHDGDIDLIAVGASSNITVQQPISTIPASDDHGAAAIRLRRRRMPESGFTGLITTDDLAVFAAGPVTLLTFSNIIRGDVSIIDTAAGQPVQFTALSDFTVGAVTGDSLFGDAVGIKSNNGEILLTSGSGIIAVEQSINSNAVGAGGTAGITLNGVHGVTVDAVILAPGPVSITTPDVGSVGLHQDIRIHANGVITSGSTIDLSSADGILIDAGASLTAQGALTMEVGMRSADSSISGLWSSLGTMNAASISISGGPNNDVFIAPADGKAEPFEGGGGVNTYVAPIVPGDITVTDSGIINAAIGNDTFSHIQVVNLSGDAGANHIDATDFTGFSVVSGGGGADVINGASVLIHPLGLTFSSTDGDAVSVKLTKGSLDATDVLLTPNAALTGADLQLLDFHGDQAFNGTKIKITAKHTATGGDGFFDLGNIDATGINLGAVTIPGDLGHISAGHGNSTGFALASLTVHSLGVRASFAQSAGGSLESDLVGKVGPIKISGDVDEASIRVTGGASPALGSITTVSIGGDLVGGDQAFSGAITASGKIGSVSIKGTMFGGIGQYSGSILTSDGASIGSVSAGFNHGRLPRLRRHLLRWPARAREDQGRHQRHRELPGHH